VTTADQDTAMAPARTIHELDGVRCGGLWLRLIPAGPAVYVNRRRALVLPPTLDTAAELFLEIPGPAVNRRHHRDQGDGRCLEQDGLYQLPIPLPRAMLNSYMGEHLLSEEDCVPSLSYSVINRAP
jgi:hypothetical protein